MEALTITVPDLMQDWVRQQIEAGKYASPSDYVRDLIRRDQDTMDAHRTVIREQIAAGFASLHAGQTVDGDTFLAKIDAEMAEQERQQS